jgi:hypothetical protein
MHCQCPSWRRFAPGTYAALGLVRVYVSRYGYNVRQSWPTLAMGLGEAASDAEVFMRPDKQAYSNDKQGGNRHAAE